MNLSDAINRVQELIGPTLAPLATDSDMNEALERALTLDVDLNVPGSPLYQKTYDPYWAAAELVHILAIRSSGEGGFQSFTSEGATFKTARPNLYGMAAELRARSSIAQALRDGHGLGVISIEQPKRYIPTSDGWTN